MVTMGGMFLHQAGADGTESTSQFPKKPSEDNDDNYADKHIHNRVARRHLPLHAR